MRIFASALVVMLGGCASIVSKSDWPVVVTSSTPGVPFTVKSEVGISVASGVTPATLILAASEGYFDGMDYTIETPGRITPLSSRLNGWYAGNLIFGGLIGLLIVDPATGAMWKLPPHVMVDAAPPVARPREEQ